MRGRGIEVQAGATVVARNLVLEENAEFGVFMGDDGASVELDGVTVRDTQPNGDGLEGRGIAVQGGSLVARELLLERNHGFGLTASGAGTTVLIEDATIRDTVPREGGITGRGVQVWSGASLVARRLVLDDNHDVGLLAREPGTTVELEDTTIRGTLPWSDGTFGRGLELHAGAHLVARRLVLEGNHDAGLAATNPGTTVELTDVEVRGTRTATDSAGGAGIVVQEGASLVGTTLLVEDNEGPGLYSVRGGSLDASDVTLRGNAFAGAVVLGAWLGVRGGTVSGSVPHPSEGGGVGVFGWDPWGPPDIELEGVEFTDLRGPALYARGPGRYRMLGNTVSGTGTPPYVPGGVLAVEGVEPWHWSVQLADVTGLLLEGNTFAGLAGDAVLLDSSSGTLDAHPDTGAANTFTDVAGLPLVWQRCSETATPDVLDGSTSAPGCLAVPQSLGPLLEYRLWLGETDPVE